ncbi:MAG: cardiolipin synthase [Clostridia bacterium]|nr:cardiolipin synthase [Clostridia bacterium]
MINTIKFVKEVLLSRAFITVVLILLQVFFYAAVANALYDYSKYLHIGAYILSIILSLYILSMKNGTFDVKLPWIVLILLFPVFGSLFYFLFHQQRVRKKIRKNIENQAYATKKIDYNHNEIYNKLLEKDKRMYNQSNYIYKTNNLPVYQNTETKYLKIGEEFFDSLLEELKKAKKFIFIEIFILKQGKMWNAVFNILKEKAAAGVDVRILYDDFGCIRTLPYNYKKHVEKYKIKCEVFNPIHPIVTLAHNNRDHRKIIVIDGNVAFTGGINLSDEYINKVIRFGHWKDTGILLKGEAVKSFTLMFLENWHIYRDSDEDYQQFMPSVSNIKCNSFIQPYMGTPMDPDELVARNVYINILNDATDYVYITTPYLILDQELENALINAAKRGVDVRIITPHIPDKKYVYAVTRSNYIALLKAGISIFEYTPGFIHAKNVCSDDKVATIGSINFDNRSFYHSYECGVWIYDSETVLDIKKDFIETEEISLKVSEDFVNKIPFSKKLSTGIWRILSPLL